MAATTVVAETLPKIISSVYISGGFPKMPDNNNNNNNTYRFYQCLVDWNGMECKKIDNPNNLQISDNNTKVIGIRTYFPEVLDKVILKRNYTYSLSVKIEK